MDGGLGAFGNIAKLGFTTGFKADEEAQARTMYKNAFDLLRKAADLYGPEIIPQLMKLYAEQQGETSLKGRFDDEGRAGQVKALGMLERQFMDPEGSPEARAAYAQASDQTLGQARAEQGSLQDSMAKRGMANSGVAAALQQQASQNATQTKSRMDLGTAAGVRSNALDALSKYMSGSSQMRGQDWQRFSQTAQAQDAINRFNANMRWQGQTGNNDVLQQLFQDKMMRGNALGNVYGNMSKFDERQVPEMRKSMEEWSNLTNGWIDAFTSMGGAGGGGGGGMGGGMGGFGGGGGF